MTKTTVFDVVEAARVFSIADGAYHEAGYAAICVNDPSKIVTRIIRAGKYVRVNVIGIGYGYIRQVRFDSNNRAIYDIVLDEPIVTAIDQSRDWVARREELEEVQA